MDGGFLPEQKTENIKNPSCLNRSVQTGGISSCVIIVEILFTVSKQYQFCFELPLLQVFTYKRRGLYLFPLNGCGGLGGYVVDDAVYALDLVYDAHGDLIEHVVGYARPICGHKVGRCH